jgi:NitT/TauT family transport system permease protein
VILLVSWEVLARSGSINTLFFPPPSVLLRTAAAMLRSGELGAQVRITLIRTVAGASLGVLAGIVTGLLMGISRRLRRSLEPVVSGLMATPKLALLPLLMLVLGIGETPRVVLIATAAFLLAALPMLDAVRALDAGYLELAKNYGAHAWDLVRWVYVPACLPYLFTGMRLALGRALGVCIAVEIVGAQEGLGQMIWAGWQTFQPEHIYLGVFCAAGLGAVFHASIRWLEMALVPWKD